MKNIIIQSVSNGFIVREYFDCANIAYEPFAVFNRLHDLQDALPDLLAAGDSAIQKPVEDLRQRNTALGYAAQTSSKTSLGSGGLK